MFRLDADLLVYVHREAVDFRKNITGLSALVEQALARDPFARAVFNIWQRPHPADCWAKRCTTSPGSGRSSIATSRMRGGR
jgi:hypothetical protein